MNFDLIYKQYFRDVFLYLRSLSANENIAEEIAQETFAKALKAIDSYDGQKDIRAWLFTIAKNTYFTDCKRQNLFSGEEPSENIAAPQSVFVEQMMDEECAIQIHTFLHNMKEPYKEVFLDMQTLMIHDSRRICYPAKAGTKVVQPVPPRSAASFSSERVNK